MTLTCVAVAASFFAITGCGSGKTPGAAATHPSRPACSDREFADAVLASLPTVRTQVVAVASAAGIADLAAAETAGSNLHIAANEATIAIRDHRPCAARLRHARALILDALARAAFGGLDAQEAAATLREGGQPSESLDYYTSEMTTFGRKLEAAAQVMRSETAARNQVVTAPSTPTTVQASSVPVGVKYFAGSWTGHTRSLVITRSGSGHEVVDTGCCEREIDLHFQITGVTGTQSRARAIAKITAVTVRDPSTYGPEPPYAGEPLALELRNGVISDPISADTYCDAAADARGACGA
jgi:hypothetical protein